MPRKEPLLGYLLGSDEDPDVRISVYKAGRTYRLAYGSQSHLCHPSITSIPLCKREAFHVFMVKVDEFQRL